MRTVSRDAPAAGNGRGVGSAELGRLGSNDTAPAVEIEHAERFLNLIDEAGSQWHFRTFNDQGRGAGRNFAGYLHDVAGSLSAANAKGDGVFAVVNCGGPKDADITRVRAVFADFDRTPLPMEFPIEPHFVVESSRNRFHAYWVTGDLRLEQFKQTQQAIAKLFGSDPSVCNLSRVMRLPGFVHRKGEPFQSRIIHESGAQPYSAATILEAFPSSTTAERSVVARAPGELIVAADRHADLLRLAGRFARQVHFEGLGETAALDAIVSEAARGRWTREVPHDEIERAFAGALAKCRSGEWTQAARVLADGHAAQMEEVELSDLMSAWPVPPQFVFDPIIPRGHATLLGAHGGAGKSSLALILCAHAVCGRSWAGFTVEQCGAVFVSLEDPGSLMRYRLRKIVEAYALDPATVTAGLRILDASDSDAALMAEVNDFGMRRLIDTQSMNAVSTAVAGAGLIVIDNASDAFDGDENNRRQVRTFVRRLTQVARANNAGLLLLAHIDKHAARNGASGNAYSGSTAWHNSVRSRLALTLTECGTIELVQEKLNLGRRADPVRLVWSMDGVLNPMPTGGNADGETARDDAEAVIATLRLAADAGIRVPTAVAGPHTACHALEQLPELDRRFRTKDGRRRVLAALVRLAREDRITRGTFRTAQRNTREVWELTQEAA